MKTKQRLLFLFLVGLTTLASCSSDDSSNGNTDPVNGVRIKTMTAQQLVGTEWKNTYKTTNTFEGSNLMMSSSLAQTWNTTTSQWTNSSQNLYTLYDSNHASQQIYQIWDAATTTWANQNRHSFTDDANGNRLKTETETWTAGVWQMMQKADFSYDSNHYLIRIDTSPWYSNSASWGEPINSIVYTNNAQGKPILTETFSGNNPTPTSKEILTYDANGFLETRITQSNNAGVWFNNVALEYTNLPNGFPDVINQTNYDPSGNMLSKSRYLYEYY